jgi:hypothetical protein
VKNIADTHRAICIAGAHRSGTSMLTRLLHRCGLFLSPKNALMPPRADNPDGFWEHLGFVALNDELLSPCALMNNRRQSGRYAAPKTSL